MSGGPLPRGVRCITTLPAPEHDGAWESIVVASEVKDQLLGTALLVLCHGRRLAALPGAANGLIVLAGPPGTGKTTLARGLAHQAAAALAERGTTTVVEIDSHSLPSEMLGESQRNVTRLLRDAVPGIATRSPHTVVLIDEVESFAVSRRAASFETNPIDVQRATDAVLEGMDHVARLITGVLFVTTTNFELAIDEAFLSRADLVVELGLPDLAARSEIVHRALADLAGPWPALKTLAEDDYLHAELASMTEGWDGRQVRKLPLRALGMNPQLARRPELLTANDLRAVARV